MCRRLQAVLALAAFCVCAATHASEPPLAGSRCAPGHFVDAEFRDAALTALDRLVVQAPGHAAHGAVRSHHSAGHVDAQGRAWHQVSAYQVNLGLIGALRVAPQLLPVVADWLRWQARHIAAVGNSRGVVFDHWVRADDFEESNCPPGIAARLCKHVDAYDSSAASTLLMADAYLRHGGDRAVLRDPKMRQALEAAADALRDLASTDGLTVATPTHRVVYTMDAVEVTAGWRAWARVQRDAYAQPQSAENSFAASTRIEASLRARLWDSTAGGWRVSLDAGPMQRGRWYPDTMAQAWPLLWGTNTGSAEHGPGAWRRAIASWQGKAHWASRIVDPDGFWWPAAAVAAVCTGDPAAARTWVARARQRWLDPEAPFAWPFQVGDLLWLLWLADPPQQHIGSIDPSSPLPTSTH